jgi:hypothetical protein
MIAAITTLTASTTTLVLAVGIARADPPVPQQGDVCNKTASSDAAMDNAQTFAPNGDVLICKPGPQVGMWNRLDGIQHPIQTWFTYGPEATLSAGDVTPGQWWVGFDGHSGTTCTVTQTSTSGGPPKVTTVNFDQMQDFQLLPDVASLKLKGPCDWRSA